MANTPTPPTGPTIPDGHYIAKAPKTPKLPKVPMGPLYASEVVNNQLITHSGKEAWSRMSHVDRLKEGFKRNMHNSGLIEKGVRIVGAAIGGAIVFDGVGQTARFITGSPVGIDEKGNAIPADWGTGLKGAAKIIGGTVLTVLSLVLGGKTRAIRG